MDAWKVSLAGEVARSGDRRATPAPRVAAVERTDPVPDGAPDFLRIFGYSTSTDEGEQIDFAPTLRLWLRG
jgi:hypothetical protein